MKKTTKRKRPASSSFTGSTQKSMSRPVKRPCYRILENDALSPNHPKIKSTTGHEWTSEQLRVLYRVAEGQNVFFTGCAGTGKSALMNHIRNVLLADRQGVYVTAPTGIAATLVGGTTIHSFAGIGLGGSVDYLLKSTRMKPHLVDRWKQVQTLIIDEISMLDGELFDTLERIAREMRSTSMYGEAAINGPVFGGIQLVVCGDFLQLPPVKASRFAFQADSWNTCFPMENQIELTTVFRQSDKEFIKLLNEVRHANLSPHTIDTLQTKVKQGRPDVNQGYVANTIVRTRLYSRKTDVQQENIKELDKLPGDVVTITARDLGRDTKVLDNLPVPEELYLKINAQVMLLRNLDMDSKLVNGSRGVVVGFVPSPSQDKFFPIVPIVQFSTELRVMEPIEWSIKMGEDTIATRRQVPLQLAWAMTIHKSQGSTLDEAELSLSDCFENGQVYVALSRLKSLDRAWIKSFDPKKVKADTSVVEYYKRMNVKREWIEQLCDTHMTKVLAQIVLDY
jgi:ATP-dependent DNA helicase PIF1